MHRTPYSWFGFVAALALIVTAAACQSAAPTPAPVTPTPAPATPTPAAVRWEYKVVKVCDLPATITESDSLACLAPDSIEKLLNANGADGWELVAIQTPLAGYGDGPMFAKPFGGYDSGSQIKIPLDFGRLIFKRPAR